MESKKVILQTIKRLKEIKAENSLTIPQIMEKLTSKGYFVSEPTLKRVFSPGSEKLNFRYQDSIAPIAEVLYAEYGDVSPSDDPEELRGKLAERDKMIEQLTIKIESQKNTAAKLEKMYADRRMLLESQIDQLKDEVELLKEQIEKKDHMFERLLNATLQEKSCENDCIT